LLSSAELDLHKLTQTINFFALNGLKYVNFKMGPVPSNYDRLLLFIIGDEVAREYIPFPGGGMAKLRLIPKHNMGSSFVDFVIR
jgi:hypothetical protein